MAGNWLPKEEFEVEMKKAKSLKQILPGEAGEIRQKLGEYLVKKGIYRIGMKQKEGRHWVNMYLKKDEERIKELLQEFKSVPKKRKRQRLGYQKV